MKILSVVSSTLGDNAASRRIINIARMLLSLGNDVHLVQYVRRSTWEKEGGNKFDLGEVPNSVIFVSTYTVHFKHLRELCTCGYDLVYGNTHSGTFLSLLGKLKKVPLIFDMHGGLVEEFLLTNSLNTISNAFNFIQCKFIDVLDIFFSDKIICVSKKMIEYLHKEKGLPLEKMAYVTNGVDLEFFKPTNHKRVMEMKEQLGIEDKFVFGYVGYFQKYQGVENLLEAARKIKDRRVAFLFVGSDRNEVERGGNIIFVPRVPYTQVPLYYSLCDVLVLPRPKHPATEMAAPTKFSEYLAMGKPVLSSDVGDAAEIIRKYNCGIIVRDNSIECLVRGVEEFMSRIEELDDMGINARKAAENEFDWNKIKGNLYEAIKSI